MKRENFENRRLNLSKPMKNIGLTLRNIIYICISTLPNNSPLKYDPDIFFNTPLRSEL